MRIFNIKSSHYICYEITIYDETEKNAIKIMKFFYLN